MGVTLPHNQNIYVMSTHIDSFYIAGFQYYTGATAIPQMTLGTKLTLKAEPTNRYDEFAVEIYYKDTKLGYLPRGENKMIHLLLRSNKLKKKDYTLLIQQINAEEHPSRQLFVGLFLNDA